MKALIVPFTLGVSAVQHLAWYVNYQVNGETRPVADSADAVSESAAA
jgi:hypothetical protein